MVLAKSEAADLPPVLLLSAGYGSRLKPLTDNTPKPLVQVGDRTLIEWHLDNIAAHGFSKVFVNLHHLGQQIVDYVGDGSRWGLEVTYSWEQELLDTAGALKPLYANYDLDELLLINSDSFFLDPVNLKDFVAAHRLGIPAKSGSKALAPIATLLLREDVKATAFGSLGLSPEGRVCKFLKYSIPECNESELSELMYCGTMLVTAGVLPLLPKAAVSSITGDVLAPAVAQGAVLKGMVHSGAWFDVGTPERLELADRAASSSLN